MRTAAQGRPTQKGSREKPLIGLADLDISKNQLADYQKLASVEETVILASVARQPKPSWRHPVAVPTSCGALWPLIVANC